MAERWYLSAPMIRRVDEYDGQPALCVAATQLGTAYTRAAADKIVAEWVEFLSAGPTPITALAFTTRTPKRLFEALRGQTQLTHLAVKWGDYEDLSVVAGMTDLVELSLKGASSVRTVAPLAALRRVTDLQIESLRHAHDLSPIGEMSSVEDLDLGGDWMSPRIAHIDSIGFLRKMPQLRRLLLHTIIVDDLDYSTVLDLPCLESVRIMKARGMRPSIEELQARLPWQS